MLTWCSPEYGPGGPCSVHPVPNRPFIASVYLRCHTVYIFPPTAKFRFCPLTSLQVLYPSSVSSDITTMSQSDHQDLEEGNHTSTFSTRRSATTSLSSQTRLGHGHPDQSQLIQLPPLPPQQSWPLYAMYSKVTQEEDNKMAERFQKAADGLLVFVSSHFTPQFLYTSIGTHRVAYSLLLSLHCLQSQSRTSSPTLRTPRPSTLKRFTSFLETKIHLMDQPHSFWPIHQHFLRQNMSSGLTHSGRWPYLSV